MNKIVNDEDYVAIIELYSKENNYKHHPKFSDIKKKVQKLYKISDAGIYKNLKKLCENKIIRKDKKRYYVIPKTTRIKEREEYMLLVKERVEKFRNNDPWKTVRKFYTDNNPSDEFIENNLKNENDIFFIDEFGESFTIDLDPFYRTKYNITKNKLNSLRKRIINDMLEW